MSEIPETLINSPCFHDGMKLEFSSLKVISLRAAMRVALGVIDTLSSEKSMADYAQDTG